MSDSPVISPPVFTARMVRELKGAPLSCLILLAVAGGPVHNEWLCRMSGYTDKPISQALKLLTSPEYQLARRTRGGWVLANAFQLVLSDDESRNFSVPATATDLDININNNNSNKTVVAVSRNFSDIEPINPNYAENLKMCLRLGIGEPSASKIADAQSYMGEFVSPEFIKAHVESLERGQGLGLAINRILSGEFPKTWDLEIDAIVTAESE